MSCEDISIICANFYSDENKDTDGVRVEMKEQDSFENSADEVCVQFNASDSDDFVYSSHLSENFQVGPEDSGIAVGEEYYTESHVSIVGSNTSTLSISETLTLSDVIKKYEGNSVPTNNVSLDAYRCSLPDDENVESGSLDPTAEGGIVISMPAIPEATGSKPNAMVSTDTLPVPVDSEEKEIKYSGLTDGLTILPDEGMKDKVIEQTLPSLMSNIASAVINFFKKYQTLILIMIILSLLARNFQLDRNLQIKKIEIEEMKKAPIKECTCMMKKETWNWDFYDASQKLLKMPDFSDSIRVSQSLNLWKDIRGSANQYFARTNGIANSLFSEPISALADATGKLKTSASSVLSEASIIPGEIKASTESIVSSVYDRASADFNKMKTSTQSSVDSVFKGARDKVGDINTFVSGKTKRFFY
mmetsp:Transcript_43256/g.101416  ORF Transcript_43256/g.101416 Transcript_43256/m.101416 type:complete len:418 (-) Transcript_43256:339-1592(-)|eukprot:CAMPEP_0113298058 /NCGR_PEP_ID=MMETSP0010_2-20120614/661_1 /TAXON_ID=216773 ORGANISM="Corethron hystrix, Strain 308" /NCGR_SAMPLE_ID=MMETSP0010_2 /ASSEMBLY_ACC=CAM_ASM_000155 /LENGTH=417 /DNA_ID=CAMNT_0000151049 /DNA_START=70 /DNA_END=1323 /DNA_ORIENTATION=+ /assembly_acc=CAM_ASM_000155